MKLVLIILGIILSFFISEDPNVSLALFGIDDAALLLGGASLLSGLLSFLSQKEQMRKQKDQWDEQKAIAEQQRRDAFLRSLMSAGGRAQLPQIRFPQQIDLLGLLKQLSNLGR